VHASSYFSLHIFLLLLFGSSMCQVPMQLLLRDIVVKWLRLAPSKGPNRVGISVLLPEGWNKSNFRNIVFSSYLEFRTMDEVHRSSHSDYILYFIETFISNNYLTLSITVSFLFSWKKAKRIFFTFPRRKGACLSSCNVLIELKYKSYYFAPLNVKVTRANRRLKLVTGALSGFEQS
jgi:hypothetical protein